MSGIVIRVLEQTKYDFTNLAKAANSSQQIIVAQHIDTSRLREGRVIVRVVSVDWTDVTNDDIQLTVLADPYDPLEGTTQYEPSGTAAVLVGPATLNPNDPSAPSTNPYAMFFELPANFGPMIMIAVGATRTASSTANLKIELMIDLALKN